MSQKRSLSERLESGVVIAAEGYVFELERRGYIKAGPFVPEVVLDYPEAVKELHREFLLAGSDVMLALTYYADREKMKTIGREGELENMNRQAVRLAREVAIEGDALVAGNIGNTWVYDPDDHEASSEQVRRIYQEQIGWAVDEGIDMVVAETLGYLGEALIALEVIKSFDLPAVINFASVEDQLKDGYSYAEACKVISNEGADVVGMNCSRGPQTLLPILEEVREAVDGYMAALPVAYATTPEQPTFQTLRDRHNHRAFPIALDRFTHSRFDMAAFAVQAQEMGINYIGVCCGGAPHHVRAMTTALGSNPPASRYSPDLSLHPMLGVNVTERDKKYMDYWKD